MENKEMKKPIPVELEEEELSNVSAGTGEDETVTIHQIVIRSSPPDSILNRTSSEVDISNDILCHLRYR